MSCAAVLSAACWVGCDSADDPDAPPLSETWGPTSEWPAFDPDRPSPAKPGGEQGSGAKPPSVPTTGANGGDGDDRDRPDGDRPADEGQAPKPTAPNPDDGPRMPPIVDAGRGNGPPSTRLDAGLPASPSGPADAAAVPCAAEADAGVDFCAPGDGGSSSHD